MATNNEEDTSSAIDDSGDEDYSTEEGSAKVPEVLQKQAQALVDSCQNTQCLDFISSIVSDKRMDMMKEESDENMSDEGMPSDD